MIEDFNKKSALITIIGRPNVGKSSLLNAVIGQKISIVSRKPQTTRTRIVGILTKDDIQLVFIDTPGVHKPRTALGKHMVGQANDSILDVDVSILVVEAGNKIHEEEKKLMKKLKSTKCNTVLVINKIDLLKDKSVLMEQISEFSKELEFDAILPISVKNRDGVNDVVSELQKFSHPGGHFFESDALTDQPERVLFAEIIREKLLRLLDKEVPHGIAVKIEHMKKRKDDVIDLHATIYCEKATHKGIIIGKNGAMLKQVGILARSDIEKFFDYKINLQLWVKVKDDWRNRESLVIPFVYEDLK